jgi:hypothetical protein
MWMKYVQLVLAAALLCCNSCNKLLDAGSPQDRQVAGATYDSDVSAARVLTGLYTQMSSGGAFMGSQGMSYLCGLSADEYLLLQDEELSGSMYRNEMVATQAPFWRLLYEYIHHANAAVQGLDNASRLTPAIRQQLLGEARFVRAFCYFYLVNLFGKVPLVTVTDYKEIIAMPRTDVNLVYDQIISDLHAAEQLLGADYVAADAISITEERLRPNKWAATALLARVYLYRENWPAAISTSSAVIAEQALYDTVPLRAVFLKDSKAAIWQLQLVHKSVTDDAALFDQQPVSLSAGLMGAFEAGDLRKYYWLSADSPYYPAKYRATDETVPASEHLMVLRLAELYLIRAEARLRTGDLHGANEDLGVLRTRAGLPKTALNDANALMAAILQERRVEFFSEWGHRWLDLKRTGRLHALMPAITAAKGGQWQAYKQWFPIPHSEILLNRHISQNEGYQE